MDFSSFMTSLGTSFLIFVVLMLIFTWLSRKPANDVVYSPNLIVKGLYSSSRTRNPTSWIKEAISSSEDDIISISGVDTAVYFVFLATGIIFISLLFLFCLLYFMFLILLHVGLLLLFPRLKLLYKSISPNLKTCKLYMGTTHMSYQ